MASILQAAAAGAMKTCSPAAAPTAEQDPLSSARTEVKDAMEQADAVLERAARQAVGSGEAFPQMGGAPEGEVAAAGGKGGGGGGGSGARLAENERVRAKSLAAGSTPEPAPLSRALAAACHGGQGGAKVADAREEERAALEAEVAALQKQRAGLVGSQHKKTRKRLLAQSQLLMQRLAALEDDDSDDSDDMLFGGAPLPPPPPPAWYVKSKRDALERQRQQGVDSD